MGKVGIIYGPTNSANNGIDIFHTFNLHWSLTPVLLTVTINPNFLLKMWAKNTQSLYVKLFVAKNMPWPDWREPSCIIQWAKPIGLI